MLPQSKVQSALKSAISDFKKALNLKSLYSKMQISRHLFKILKPPLRFVQTTAFGAIPYDHDQIVTAMEHHITLHIAYYKWSAVRRITLR